MLGGTGREAGDQDVVAHRSQTLGDGDDLLGGLALAEHHLGKSVAQAAVVVEPREAEILVGQRTQPVQRLVDGTRAAPDGLEQLGQTLAFHETQR